MGQVGVTGPQGPQGPAAFLVGTAEGYDDPSDIPYLFGPVPAQAPSRTVWDVTSFGAIDDLVTVFDGAITSGTANLACTTSTPFLPSDQGKRIIVTGAGASGAALVTTILTYTDSGHVVLAANAGSTVSNKGVNFGTDNATQLQNAINFVGSIGGGVLFFSVTRTGRYGVSTGLTISHDGITLMGANGGDNTDIGNYALSGSSWLCWWAGAAPTTFTNGILLAVAPVQGASNPALTGFNVRSLSFDCRNGDQNQALIGIQIYSGHGWVMSDVFVTDASAVAIDTGVVTTLGEARDCTRWLMERIGIRMLDNPSSAVTTPVTTSSAVTLSATPQSLTVAANTLTTAGFVWIMTNCGYPALVNYTGGGGTTTLTGCSVSALEAINAPTTVSGSNVVQAYPGNGCALRFDGDTTANTCCATINTLQINHGTTWGPAAVCYRNCDSLQTYNAIINGGLATVISAINRTTKPGVRLNGSVTNATLAARNNVFDGGSAGAGGVCVMGLSATGAVLSAASGPHYWNLYQLGNSEPVPVVEFVATSATQGPARGSFDWNPNGGFRSGGRIAKASIVNQTISATTSLVDGSLVVVPPQGFQVGTVLQWTIPFSKTAAGTAARTVAVKYGTAGSTSDGTTIATASFTPTAVVDQGVLTITLVVTALGSGTSATALCQMDIVHTSATAVGWGASAITATMAGFNSTLPQSGNAFLEVVITTGTAEVLTIIAPVVALCLHPGNP